MATNRRQPSTQRRPAGARAAAQQRKSKRKMIIFMIEVVIILIMLVVLWLATRIDSSGPVRVELPDDPVQLAIPEEIQQAKEDGDSKMLGYRNIALFGLDATNEKQVAKNSRSDSIMIASINMDTGDIKLVSVYRDTYLNIGTDTYTKCNSAYAKGGAEQAIKMLNMNLDMDIEDFVTVGYDSLIDVIDGLGGVYLEIKENEIGYLNDYQRSIVATWKYGVKLDDNTVSEKDFKDVKVGVDYIPIKEPGYQLVDGLQAAAYCRIRYVGNDYARTERQRTVLKAIQDQAKKAGPDKLIKVFNDVICQVFTSLDAEEMLELIGDIAKYRIVDESGFPQMDQLTTGNIGASGNCIVPMDLESNVIWLHQFLFDDEDYQVTKTVKECGEEIKAKTSQYIN